MNQPIYRRPGLLLLCVALVGACVGLSACSSADDELVRFIEDTKKEPGGRVEPLPEIKPYETYVYAAGDMRSPFLPSSPGSGAGLAGVRPDQKRNREFLEQYSLDTLKMVGTLRLGGQMFGLVETKDGLVHRVTTGNHLGQSGREDHRNHALENQSRRNRSGQPRRVHRASRGARPERVRSSREFYQMHASSLMNRLLGSAAWLLLAGALGLAPTAPARAADQPALQAIDVQALPNQQLQLTMRLSGPAPQPLTFTIDNPARISLDLPNTTLALPSRRIDVHASGLDTILAAETKDRTRVVLNLDKLVPYDTRVDGRHRGAGARHGTRSGQRRGTGRADRGHCRWRQRRARAALHRLPPQRRRRGARDRASSPIRTLRINLQPGRQPDRRRVRRRRPAGEPRAPLRRHRLRHPGHRLRRHPRRQRHRAS